VSEWLQASRLQLAACPANHRRWRELIAGLNSIVTVTLPDVPVSRDSLERRISVIRSRLKRDRASRYQRSLFDRRADADAASGKRLPIGSMPPADAAKCHVANRL
jgi:hypothetical protein